MAEPESKKRVVEIQTLSHVVSWYLSKGYCSLEELIFMDTTGTAIVPVSNETVTLLTQDTPEIRTILDAHIYEITSYKQTPYDEADEEFEDVYGVLKDAGAKLEGITWWDMYVLNRTMDNLSMDFGTPLKAAAHVIAARHLLREKKSLVDDVATSTMEEFLGDDELVGDVFQKRVSESLMHDILNVYWQQNALLREAFARLEDASWDAYGAVSVLLNAAEEDKQTGGTIDMDVPIAQSILDVLAKHGMNLPEWLFLYENRESILFDVNMPAFLFTQDWLADCIKQTLDSAEFEPGERVEDYEPWYDFISPEARVINNRQFFLVEDIAHAFRRAQTMQDTKRKRWELWSQLGAVEAIYGKKGWEWLQCAIASAQDDSEEDPNQAWLRAGELLYNQDIDALRSGNLAPEAYTRMYLAHASRFPRQYLIDKDVASSLRRGIDAWEDEG